jgi:UDP-2-acetamido-3-amino-2,3-dideoxy-glucuronate N-acetyltransferase
MSQAVKKTLGLIGAGYWGKNLARNFFELGALHTICDSDDGLLKTFRAQYGVETQRQVGAVFENPGIKEVVVAAPAAQHYVITKAALLAGKDVFVEKPLCLDEREGEELLALAQEKNRILMVGHLLQYHPCIQALQTLLAEGRLGQLYYIASNRLNLGKIRQEENALWSFAPHDISVILSLVGHQMPEKIICTGESYLTRGIPDTTMTNMRFGGGVAAHIYVSWLNPFKEQKLTVIGSLGMVVFDDMKPWPDKLMLYRDYLTWADGQVPVPNKSAGESVQVQHIEPLRNECAHFLDCCGTRQKPRTDAAEGLRVLRVLHAAQASLDNGGQPRSVQTKSAPGQGDHFVHPTAVVDQGALVGHGTKIWHFSHIMAGARIGEHCVIGQNVNVDGGTILGNNVKIQNNVSVYTGLVIEDDVFLGPSCVLTNVSNPRSQVNRHKLYEKTTIKRGATIGANATVVPGVTIGRYAFIGAGAVVTRDVPDYAFMIGNPARRKGWMSRHGHVLNNPGPDGIMSCPESGLHYKEVESNLVRCLDLDEEAPLPAELKVGTTPYRSFSPRRTG